MVIITWMITYIQQKGNAQDITHETFKYMNRK